MLIVAGSILMILAAIYVCIGLLNHIGLSKKYNTTRLKPSVSILVAARNEEQSLHECLLSLEGLDYPQDLLQVFVINDRSTDRTRQIALSFCNRLNHFELIDIRKEVDGLFGKMNALCQGLDQAGGEIILVTDADCLVPPTWVEDMCSYFTDRIAIVGGLTIIDDEKPDLLSHLQQFDWFFLQAIASGTTGLGIPVSILGNNFGFKKSVYDELGGFRSIGFSMTEDLALLKQIVGTKKYEVAYRLSKENMITSFPLESIKDFYEQRKRWLRGGVKVNAWGWVMMLTSFAAHLMIPAGIFMKALSPTFLFSILAVLAIDYSLIRRIFKRINRRSNILYFIAYEIFYVLYSTSLAISLLVRSPIQWKQRTYKHKQ